jgi:outer membrane protein assembly factor BamB
VVEGVVYVGSDDGKLYAFNASNGSILWRTPTGSQIESSPAVVGGVSLPDTLQYQRKRGKREYIGKRGEK